jgi:hypothetical protein
MVLMPTFRQQRKLFVSLSFHRLTALCASIATLFIFAAKPAHAYDYNGTPAGSQVLLQLAGSIKSFIQSGWRPTSIELETSIASLRYYRVTYVQNTGTQYQEVRFESELTSAQLQTVVNSGWRVEDIATVGTRLSAILIRNTLNPRTTVPFWDWSVGQVQLWLAGNPSYRLLDLDRYTLNGVERYSGVFLQNTGAAYTARWVWGSSSTWDQIRTSATQNNLRVIDLDRRPDGRYTWVGIARKAGERYYYFGNRTLPQVLEFLGGYGLRAHSLNETTVDGVRRYSGTAVNRVSTQAARLAELSASRHNGVQGYYLRQIGGATLVDLNGSLSMHPSSTIKVLLHFTGVHLTAANQLNTRRLTGNQLMSSVHSQMMWFSDNTMANLCLDDYTIASIESVAHNTIGMSQTTQIRNRFGTGGPYSNDEITTTTLNDLARLYERVSNGHFDTTKDPWFRTNMISQANSTAFNTVLNSVRTELGLTATQFNDYKTRIRFLFKAGNNAQNGINGYWSTAGLISLPLRSGTLTVTRSYVFGHYVNGTTEDYSSTEGFEAMGETLREQIRSTMLTFRKTVP